MKKIVHICISCFYVDNMGYQENILPKKHKQQGYEVKIITTQRAFNETGKPVKRAIGEYLNENGIPVIVLPYKKILGKLSKLLHFVSGLYHELQVFKPDIIFCHGLSFLSIYDVKRYCKHNNVKLYCDCHSDYFNTPTDKGKYRLLNGIFWPNVAKSVINECKIAWGVTPARCEYLKSVYHYPDSKVKLLVMGGDDDFIHLNKRDDIRAKICKDYNLSSSTFLITTGGKLNKEKRVLELIKACSTIKKDMALLVFGSLAADIKEEFEKLVNHKNIVYVGWANQEKIYNIFVASDLVVFPGTHSVLWEQAVACGVPCVFMDRDMMKHVDVGGNCVFLPKDDVETIHHTLINILDDKDSYQKMKEVAINKGVEYFSYASIAKRSIEEPC